MRARKPDTRAIDLRDLERLVHPRQGLPALTTRETPLFTIGSPNVVGLKATPAKWDEERDDTTRLGMNDDVKPQRAELEGKTSLVAEKEPTERAAMEVESAIAAASLERISFLEVGIIQ